MEDDEFTYFGPATQVGYNASVADAGRIPLEETREALAALLEHLSLVLVREGSDYRDNKSYTVMTDADARAKAKQWAKETA
jgi:hypothetical protein